MTINLRKIISGGQTGADRGGLDAARSISLEIGGYCPDGRRAEDGPIPPIYPLLSMTSKNYEHRTRQNIQAADATIIFNAERAMSAGSNLTRKSATDLNRPWVVIYGPPTPVKSFQCRDGVATLVSGVTDEPLIEAKAAEVALWLQRINPTTLNVAGNRESVAPGIQVYVAATLRRAFQLAQTKTPAELQTLLSPPEAGKAATSQMNLF